MSTVLLAGVVLFLGQSLAALGTEVVIIALISPAYSIRGMIHLPRPHRLARSVELVVGLVAATLVVLAGFSLIAQVGGGLWLLLPGAAIALGSSVWNAWRLMVDVAADDES
jgi:uncharacterized membrane protein